MKNKLPKKTKKNTVQATLIKMEFIGENQEHLIEFLKLSKTQTIKGGSYNYLVVIDGGRIICRLEKLSDAETTYKHICEHPEKIMPSK